MNNKEKLTKELKSRGYFRFDVLSAERVNDKVYRAVINVRGNKTEQEITLNYTDADFKEVKNDNN